MLTRSRTFVLAAAVCVLALPATTGSPLLAAPAPTNGPQFSVSFPKERSATPLDGRLLLLLSNDGSSEPRMQIALAPRTQMVFGVDVDNMQPGLSVTIDDSAFGYPVRYLHDVPAG